MGIRDRLRPLRSRPHLAIALCLTIAIGVGGAASTAAIAYPVFSGALPYPGDHQIVAIIDGSQSTRGDQRVNLTELVAAEQLDETFEAVGGYFYGGSGYLPDGREIEVAKITSGFLEVIGSRPAIGRPLTPDEYNAEARVCLITDDLWREFWAPQAAVLGAELRLGIDGENSCEVVGVLPEGFLFPNTTATPPVVLVPGRLDNKRLGNARGQIDLIARLKAGGTVDRATSQVRKQAGLAEQVYPRLQRNREIAAIPLHEAMFGENRPMIIALAITIIGTILLAALNLTQLSMAAFRARVSEFRLRLALGASPINIVRLLFVESAAPALVGGVLASLISWFLVRSLISAAPPSLYSYTAGVQSFRLAVVLVTVGGIVAFVAIAVMAPVLLTWSELGSGVNPERFRSSRWSVRRGYLLLAVQIGLSFAIVTSGALVGRSLWVVEHQALGFDYSNLQIIQPEQPTSNVTQVATSAPTLQTYASLRARFGDAIAMSLGFPTLWFPGVAVPSGASAPQVPYYLVTASAFKVGGFRILRGRSFVEDEASKGAAVAVVDVRAADLWWPGKDPLGQQIRGSDGVVRSVVGMVATVQRSLDGSRPPTGTVLLPIGDPGQGLVMYLYQDGSGPTRSAIEAAVKATTPTAQMKPQPLMIFGQFRDLQLAIVAVFSALSAMSLALMVIGVMGLVSHLVMRRTWEVAVRSALGASPGGLKWLLVRDHILWPCLPGLTVGLILAVFVGRGIEEFLFKVGPADRVAYSGAAVTVVLSAVIGGFIPAWRCTATPVARLLSRRGIL